MTIAEKNAGRIKIQDVPYDDIETAINFNVRDMGAVPPARYLDRFLPITRQFAYATEDDSWGELEKELQIIIRTLVMYSRVVDLVAEATGLSENSLVEMGEDHFVQNMTQKRSLTNLRARLSKAVTE